MKHCEGGDRVLLSVVGDHRIAVAVPNPPFPNNQWTAMPTLNDPLRPLRAVFAVVVTAGLLSACATSGSGPSGAAVGEASMVGADSQEALPPAVAAFLDEAVAGAVTELAESPWGREVTVTAGPAYFAASGRKCRPLRIGDGDEAQEALACRSQSGWVEQRLLSRQSMREAW